MNDWFDLNDKKVMMFLNLQKLISFACCYRSYKRFKKNVHYLAQIFWLTGWPCVRISSFSTMSIHSIGGKCLPHYFLFIFLSLFPFIIIIPLAISPWMYLAVCSFLHKLITTAIVMCSFPLVTVAEKVLQGFYLITSIQ